VLTRQIFTDNGSLLGNLGQTTNFEYNFPGVLPDYNAALIFMTNNFTAPIKPSLLIRNKIVTNKVRTQTFADTSNYTYNYYDNGDLSSIFYNHTQVYIGSHPGSVSEVYDYNYTYDSGKKQPFANVKGNLFTFVIPTSANNTLTETLNVFKSTPLNYDHIYYYNTYTYNTSGFPVKKVTGKVSGNSTTTTTYVYTYISVPVK